MFYKDVPAYNFLQSVDFDRRCDVTDALMDGERRLSVMQKGITAILQVLSKNELIHYITFNLPYSL